MIFSCTKKVRDKLKKYQVVEAEKVETGFYNWYVDLITLERKNYFLFTNSQTLFTFFFYAGTRKELQNIDTLFEEQLKAHIVRAYGPNLSFIHKALAGAGPDRFIHTNSRSVLGSMNDLKYQIEVQVWHKGPLSFTYELVHELINMTPMSALGYASPLKKMQSELEQPA